MLNFFQRLASPSSSPGRSSTSTESPRSESPAGWSPAFASDPSQWEATFEQCWDRVNKMLELKELNPEHEISYDEMTQLLVQLTKMCQLLMMEANAQPEPAIGAILDKYFTQQILERVMDWAIQVPEFNKVICQLALIRIYEGIVNESHTQNHCLLVHKPVLNPLLRLFEWCKRAEGMRPAHQNQPSARDKHFVLLLNQICTKLGEDKTLLHFFFNCSEGANQFVVFSLLIPFLYEQNDVGQLARDALLLILSVSAQHDHIAEFVADRSAFCPVVATGLSGCYSQLPRILAPEGGDRLVPEFANDTLANFSSSLLFCNAVVQAAHPAVIDKICSYFYSGYLISVVKPSLLQDEREAVAAATAYLQVCIDTISEAALLKTIIKMLLVEGDEENNMLIDVIVSRIRGYDRLALSSLQLVDCLLQLGCEDVMIAVVLKYLLPMRHTNRHQLQRIREASHTSDVAHRILKCIPDCMLNFHDLCSQETLSLYHTEGSALVDKRAVSSASWKWRYDGINPSHLLFRSDSEDERSSHTSFSRLNSCRSSRSSALHGLNRYFASRAAHLTAESTCGPTRLVALGGSPSGGSLEDVDDEIQEDSDFVLPPINTSSIMTASMVDYFQFAAFDDTSESEDSPSSPTRKEMNKTRLSKTTRLDSISIPSESESTTTSNGRGFDTDAEMARSFVLTGWSQLEDMETFLSMVDSTVLSKDTAKSSVAECTAFIDAKVQYYDEMKLEDSTVTLVEEQKGEMEAPVECMKGVPIIECTGAPPLMQYLLEEIEKMSDHSLMYNITLASTLTSLCSYPQPILVALMFDLQKTEFYPNLIAVLSDLKKKVDQQSSTIEGLDIWVSRALRSLNARAERVDRLNEVSKLGDSPRDDGLSTISSFIRGRTFGNSGRKSQIRYHTHKVVESLETAQNDEKTKNIVHAAIVLSNLCQFLAGIALHQSVVVVGNYHNSN